MTSGSERPLGLIAAAVMAASPSAACSAQETPMPSQKAIPAQTAAVVSVEEVYGLWSVRDGEARCRIALSAQKNGSAHQASVERCAISVLADGSTWRPVVGGFELLGPGDRVLGRFRMTGVDGFESTDGKLRGERAAEM